jgi:hypothetical protein
MGVGRMPEWAIRQPPRGDILIWITGRLGRMVLHKPSGGSPFGYPPYDSAVRTVFGKEAGLAVVATLYDVQRHAVKMGPWTARHGGNFGSRRKIN